MNISQLRYIEHITGKMKKYYVITNHINIGWVIESLFNNLA
jgi:hypothetical protein